MCVGKQSWFFWIIQTDGESEKLTTTNNSVGGVSRIQTAEVITLTRTAECAGQYLFTETIIESSTASTQDILA